MKERKTKKNILIIGASIMQLPAIIKAKEMGHTVIVIDRNPNAPGMSCADFSYPIDVKDFDGALKIAKQHKINGVMTMQSDLPVPTIGLLNDYLHLKGSGYDTAINCSNKIATRKKLAKHNIPQPKFEIITNAKEAIAAAEKIGYPCVIKAPDSSGSRGVTKIDTKKQIENAILESYKYTNSKELLVEEFIAGTEIGAQGFSISNKCVKVLVHNDTITPPPFMVPRGHSFPVFLTDSTNKKIKKEVSKALNVLGIEDGASNIDLILDKKKQPQIIEIGARIGATCLPELVEYYTGINWVEQSINACLGDKVDLSETKKQPVVAYIIEASKDGVFQDYQIPKEITEHPQVKEVEVTAKKGDSVSILRKGTDRIGKLIVTADSVKHADDLAKYFLKKITLNIK